MEAWFLQRNWRSYASPEWVLGRKICHWSHERERTASIAWAAKIAILRALQVPTTAVSMSYSSRFEDEPLHKLRRWRSRSSRPVSIEGNNLLQAPGLAPGGATRQYLVRHAGGGSKKRPDGRRDAKLVSQNWSRRATCAHCRAQVSCCRALQTWIASQWLKILEATR